MPSPRDLCVQSAQAHGLSIAEAEQLVDFIRDKKVNGDPARAAEAVQAAIDGELARTAAAKRRAKLNAVVRKALSLTVDEMVAESNGKMNAVDAVLSLLSGSEKNVAHSRESAFAAAQGLRNRLEGRLMHGLHEAGLEHLARHDKSFSDNVIREMREPGSTGDVSARNAARLLSEIYEELRITLNNEGAGTGKLENYCPQTHDELKISQAGFEEWANFIRELIDWDRTMPEASPEEIPQILENIYQNIIYGVPHKPWRPNVENPRGPWDPNGGNASGGNGPSGGSGGNGGNGAGGGQGSGGKGGSGASGGKGKGAENSLFARGRNIASSFEHRRVIHFKDAESAVAYNNRFGKGSVFDSILWEIHNGSQKYGVMRIFGTDAAYNIQTVLSEAAERARTEGRDPSLYLKAWDVDGQGKAARLYKEVAGEVGTPQNLTLARVGSTLRAVTSMAKLGAATLSSITDVATHYGAARAAGADLFRSIREGFSMKFGRLQSEAKLRLGRQLGVFTRAYLGEMYRGFDAADSVPGVVSKLLMRYFKLTGLTQWTEAHKAGYTFFMSNELAHAAREGANADFAVVLHRHGMEKYLPFLTDMIEDVEGECYVIPEKVRKVADDRLAPLIHKDLQKSTAELDKAKYFQKKAKRLAASRSKSGSSKPAPTADELRDAYAEARAAELDKAREHVMTDLMSFFSDETGYAILEPDARANAVMRQGTRAGTPVGEMLRLMMQFKAFPVTFWQRWIDGSHWQRASRQSVGGLSGFDWRNRFGNDVPGLIGFMAASLGLGYLAMTAKDLSKGRNFRDPQKASTWVAALLQSGGLGLMGDFFLGTADRFGGGGANFAAGPFLSDFLGTVPVMTGMAARGEFKEAAEVGAKYLMNNMELAAIPLAQAAARRAGPAASLLNLGATLAMSPNMWYTRAAFDYALGFHIREMLNPGTLRRMERKMLNENNQTYIIKPSDIIRRGGGFR